MAMIKLEVTDEITSKLLVNAARAYKEEIAMWPNAFLFMKVNNDPQDDIMRLVRDPYRNRLPPLVPLDETTATIKNAHYQYHEVTRRMVPDFLRLRGMEKAMEQFMDDLGCQIRITQGYVKAFIAFLDPPEPEGETHGHQE